MDNIAFGLLSKAGLSGTSVDYEVLNDVMKYTYGFIDRCDYFNKSMGNDIFRGETLHRIDYNLFQSENPQKDIDNYYKKARAYYISLGYKNDIATGMANELKGQLEKYEERRNIIFDTYSEYLLNCLQ